MVYAQRSVPVCTFWADGRTATMRRVPRWITITATLAVIAVIAALAVAIGTSLR